MKTGRVVIFEDLGGQTTTEGAGFLDLSGTTGVSERVEGPCVIRSSLGSPGAKPSAGDITITSAADVVTLGYGIAQSGYVAQTQQGRHYAAGASLAVAAAGDTVPVFAGNLVFPELITVTSPPVAAPFNLDASQTFTATWTGNNAKPVKIQIDQFPITQNVPQLSLQIVCAFAGTSGSVPPSAMNNLVTNQAQDFRVAISIGRIDVETIAAGEYGVLLEALNVAFQVNGFASEPL